MAAIFNARTKGRMVKSVRRILARGIACHDPSESKFLAADLEVDTI